MLLQVDAVTDGVNQGFVEARTRAEEAAERPTENETLRGIEVVWTGPLAGTTDEMITASDRHRVEERLIEVLRPLEEKRSTTRIGIVDQQVLLAREVVDGSAMADRSIATSSA